MNEQIASGTAYYQEYVEEDFQLTLGEAILGVRYTDVPRRFSEVAVTPSVRFSVIDGELYLLDEGAPPGLDPLPEEAGILQARGH